MAEQEEDLEAEGLIAESYDSLFAIDKRIHKVQDIYVPGRNGLTTTQIGTFFAVGAFMLIFDLLALGPLLGLLHIPESWVLFLLVVFGPAVLSAWRVTKPMPNGKTIPGTLQSLVRYLLDDKVHRRGLPVKTPIQPSGEPVQHFQRDWAINQEFAPEFAGEGDWTDPVTEYRLATASGGHVDLQAWMDTKAIEHYQAAQASKATTTKERVVIHDRRGSIAATAEA